MVSYHCVKYQKRTKDSILGKFSERRMDGQMDESDFSDYAVRPTLSVQQCAMEQEKNTGTPVSFYKT